MAAVEVSRNRLMNFEITSQEVNQLKEALADEKFRNLLIEYSKEINDPSNRQLYESQLAEYEREQGCTEVVQPSANYVIKTWHLSGGKIMINICSSPQVEEPQCQVVNEHCKSGQEWSIPYMIGSCRQEMDRKKNACDVIDVIFHDRTLHLLKTSPAFKKLVDDTALDAVESRLNSQINKENVKFPKLKYKGAVVQHCVLRTQKQEPSYEIVYRENSFHVKTALIIKIKLTELSSTEDCILDVTDHALTLQHQMYNLQLELPVKVNSDKGKAFFDPATKCLIVELPVYHQNDSMPLANNALNNQLLSDRNETENRDSVSDDQITENLTDNNPDRTVDNITAQCEAMVINQPETREESKSNHQDGKRKEAPNNNNNYWSENNDNSKLPNKKPALKTRSFSESSDDWCMSHSPCKSILKRSFSISSNEMSQSFELTEEQEEEDGGVDMQQQLATSVNNGSVKKSVSFSDIISKQVFRPDSSILGQRKKNQRRARNKRKNQGNKRTNSESEDVCSENETAGKTTEFASDLMFDLDM